MAIHNILKMGDPRLLQQASPVEVSKISTAEIQSIIQDLLDTMKAANGAGLAAPQIGIDLQIVVFGFEKSSRYRQAEPVPQTILINPVITPLSTELEEGWEGCLSVPGLRGVVPRYQKMTYCNNDAKYCELPKRAYSPTSKLGESRQVVSQT
jgi:peptide deformylase